MYYVHGGGSTEAREFRMEIVKDVGSGGLGMSEIVVDRDTQRRLLAGCLVRPSRRPSRRRQSSLR